AVDVAVAVGVNEGVAVGGSAVGVGVFVGDGVGVEEAATLPDAGAAELVALVGTRVAVLVGIAVGGRAVAVAVAGTAVGNATWMAAATGWLTSASACTFSTAAGGAF